MKIDHDEGESYDSDSDSTSSESCSEDENGDYEQDNPLSGWHRRLGHLAKGCIKHPVRMGGDLITRNYLKRLL